MNHKLVKGEVVLLRLSKGEDLITKIEEVCDKYSFRGASIVSAIGSLENATYIYAVKDSNKIKYNEPVLVEGPIEILTCQGTYGEGIHNNTFTTHLHYTISDSNGLVYGGHVVKNENKALVTIEITIIGYKENTFKKYDDTETGFCIFDLK